jgi:hypothetical protein
MKVFNIRCWERRLTITTVARRQLQGVWRSPSTTTEAMEN